MTNHPLANIAEWRKGCGNALPQMGHDPAECSECTKALIEAIEKWFLGNEPWRPMVELTTQERYAGSYLLHCPDLISEDFNPQGVVDGYWQDEEGWLAGVFCGYHDEWHTKVVNPTHYMPVPKKPNIPTALELLGLEK